MTDYTARKMWLERRAARHQQNLAGFAMTNRKHAADMREIREEYDRVSQIYIRHLERLLAKASKIVTVQKANEQSFTTYLANYHKVV